MLLATGAFLALAVWQLGRADEKRQLQAIFEARLQQPPLEYKGGELDPDLVQYRRLRLEGHFLREGQLLLDNVVMDGRPGYEVITPFRLQGDGVVLVDRGWVPLGRSRALVPEIPVPAESLQIDGG